MANQRGMGNALRQMQAKMQRLLEEIGMNDTISRQQTITALRALSDEDGFIHAPHEVVTDVVRGLPPVKAKQGQTTRSEQGETDKLGVKTGETYKDTISRQALCEYALNQKDKSVTPNDIMRFPSAQPVLTCDGCRHVGTYDTDFPCNGCVRREKDYYDPER